MKLLASTDVLETMCAEGQIAKVESARQLLDSKLAFGGDDDVVS
jgi:hypothetical protein